MDIFTVIKCVAVVALISVLYGFYYLKKSGCFNVVKIWIGRPDFYELQIAYKMYKGDYMKSGHPFAQITKLLPKLPCINVYYDDPEKVPAEQCRYLCGVVLSEGLDDIADVDNIRRAKDYGFKLANFPRVDRVMKTTFPFATMMSPMLGAMKVYPKLAKYSKENSITANPYMEICKDGVIHYMCIMDKCSEFIVEECKE